MSYSWFNITIIFCFYFESHRRFIGIHDDLSVGATFTLLLWWCWEIELNTVLECICTWCDVDGVCRTMSIDFQIPQQGRWAITRLHLWFPVIWMVNSGDTDWRLKQISPTIGYCGKSIICCELTPHRNIRVINLLLFYL